MKTALVLTSASLTALFLSFVRADEPAQKPAAPPAKAPGPTQEVIDFLKPVEVKGDDLTKLLQERYNSALTLLDERAKEYRKGHRELSSVFNAARLALEARLELATSPEEKAQVLEHAVGVARGVEKHLQEQLAKEFGSKADLAQARHARLSLQVALHRAKQEIKPK